MVGLSVVLEPNTNKNTNFTNQNPQVINKAMFMTITKPSSQTRHSPPQDFLDRCFLCNKKLLPGNDIYMYKGDRGFCSVECRCRQMYMDEEEGFRSCRSKGRTGNKNRSEGGFAY